MEALPFVDEYVSSIAAPSAVVWSALVATLRRQMTASLPRPLARLWGIGETERRGEWQGDVAVGDTLLGFSVAESQREKLLSLRGHHRFSRYELRFELDDSKPGAVAVHAKTFAEFPGVLGRIYRALVIGTGGHRIVVKRMLASLAARATRNSVA